MPINSNCILCRLEVSGFFRQREFDEAASNLVKMLAGSLLHEKHRLLVVESLARADLKQWKPVYLSKIITELMGNLTALESVTVEVAVPSYSLNTIRSDPSPPTL